MEAIYQNNDTSGLEDLYTHEVILLIDADYVKKISTAALAQLQYHLENRTNELQLSNLTQEQKDEAVHQSDLKYIVQSGVTRGETSASHIAHVWGQLFNSKHPDTEFEVWIADKSTQLVVRFNEPWRGDEKDKFHQKIKSHFRDVRPCVVLHRGHNYYSIQVTSPGVGFDANKTMKTMRKFMSEHPIKKFQIENEKQILLNFKKVYDYPQLMEHKLQPAVVAPTVRTKV